MSEGRSPFCCNPDKLEARVVSRTDIEIVMRCLSCEQLLKYPLTDPRFN